jgi:hypothetical protein
MTVSWTGMGLGEIGSAVRDGSRTFSILEEMPLIPRKIEIIVEILLLLYQLDRVMAYCPSSHVLTSPWLASLFSTQILQVKLLACD